MIIKELAYEIVSQLDSGFIARYLLDTEISCGFMVQEHILGAYHELL